jgi:predicted DNA-binding transcriptional regulator YafY
MIVSRSIPDRGEPKRPRGIASIEPSASDGTDWVLLRLRAQRLDWLPHVLAGLGLPFVVREPAELRDIVRAWTDRIAGCAAATSPQEAVAAWGPR